MKPRKNPTQRGEEIALADPAYRFTKYPHKSVFVNDPVVLEVTVLHEDQTLDQMLEHIQMFLAASGYDFSDKCLGIVEADKIS